MIAAAAAAAAAAVSQHDEGQSLASLRLYLHCKNIRISTDILWRVFRVLTEPTPYTFVSVNRRNNEAPVIPSIYTDTGLLTSDSKRIVQGGYTDIFTVYFSQPLVKL